MEAVSRTGRSVTIAAVAVTVSLVAAGAVGLNVTDGGTEDVASAAGIDQPDSTPDRSGASPAAAPDTTTSSDGEQVASGSGDDGSTDTEAVGDPSPTDDAVDSIDIVDAEPSDAAADVRIETEGPAELVLADADLDVELDADGQVAPGTTGVATLQLPTEGPLAGAMLDRPLRGSVGVALGRDLAHLGAHLRDGERYFYSDLGSQPFDLFLDFDRSQDGADALPQQISTDGGGGASMFVAALDGDYFYLSTPCPAMIPADGGQRERPARQQESGLETASASEIPGVSADLSSFDPGGCGIGWSVGGFVPFTPIIGQRGIAIPTDFGAHVVVDGTIPVHPAASLDGELFYRFESDRASVWANGELDIGVSFLKGAAEVNLPAVRGTFGMTLTPSTFDLAITATAGSSAADGSSAELLADIAPIRGQVDLDGELHIESGDVLATSFLQLSGDISISPEPVRTSSGVEVDDVLSADALVRIDRNGVMATGSVAVSPVSTLSVNGSAELEFLVPFADANLAYLEVSGELGLGDSGLGADARLRVDSTGATAHGRVELAGFGGLDVEGRLGADGFQLTGSVDAVLPIGDLDQVAANLVDTTGNAEVIRVLDAQIDERVAQIASSDPAKGTELTNTIADMRTAFTDIASVRDTIAYNDRLIADLRDDHQADIDWHWALNDFDRFWDKGPHAIRLAAILVEIEALKFANTVQYGYIDVANTVVAATQQAVLAIIGWDQELNALFALQTEAYVNTLAGNFVATVLYGADAVLDAFGIDGSAVGSVTFAVGTDAIAASAELDWCRDGSCQRLADASVSLVPHVEVCATIAGLPACVVL